MATCSIVSCDGKRHTRGWCQTHYMRFYTTGSPRADVPIRRRIQGDDTRRFWSHVQREPGDGCWLFEKRMRVRGYGRLKLNGRSVAAHRWAYEQEHGPIPVGLDLDHLCRTQACVRPLHLEPVTKRENQRRLRHGHALQDARLAERHRVARGLVASEGIGDMVDRRRTKIDRKRVSIGDGYIELSVSVNPFDLQEADWAFIGQVRDLLTEWEAARAEGE